jgi:hypothetical protein
LNRSQSASDVAVQRQSLSGVVRFIVDDDDDDPNALKIVDMGDSVPESQPRRRISARSDPKT